MAYTQIPLPLFRLIKSHTVHARVNDVMLNTRVRRTVYISVHKKHDQQGYIFAKLVKTVSVSTYITDIILKKL